MMRHFFALILAVSIVGNAAANEIKLKDGRTVNGKIIERTQDSIKVDTGAGINLSYYLDQIVSIDGQPAIVKKENVPQNSVKAPKQSAPSKTSPPTPQSRKAFIWEVQSATTTSYILGSIHVADESFYPLAVPIEKAFQRADVLVVETDSEMDPALEEELKDKAMYKDGQTLKDDISQETLNMLKVYLAKYKIDVTPFLILRPWMVSIMLGQISMANMGLNPLLGVDEHFLRLAKKRKRIEQLEDIRQQVDLISGLMGQDIVLKYTLQDIADSEKNLKETIRAWKSGDTQTLERLVFETGGDNPIFQKFMDEFLFKRNEKMVEKIDGYLHGHDVYFIVVGAAHLLGEKGILHVLKQKGYRLRQL